MSNDNTQFIDGLIVKAPNERAPEYVKAKISIKRESLIAFLQNRDDEWINAEIKESRGGKWYVAIDAWKPDSNKSGQSERPRQEPRPAPSRDASYGNGPAPGFDDSEIPFAPIPRRQLW